MRLSMVLQSAQCQPSLRTRTFLGRWVVLVQKNIIALIRIPEYWGCDLVLQGAQCQPSRDITTLSRNIWNWLMLQLQFSMKKKRTRSILDRWVVLVQKNTIALVLVPENWGFEGNGSVNALEECSVLSQQRHHFDTFSRNILNWLMLPPQSSWKKKRRREPDDFIRTN